ncbi:MAG: hypothetical protein DWQ46_05485 [Planctomycetota bacterium]|nr:MAG: hypothetical protein DWQ46_05485 [Planctomycetota bacterium]
MSLHTRLVTNVAGLIGCLLLAVPLWAQTDAARSDGDPSAADESVATEAPEATLVERTLPLRTALHHDPSLVAPLEQLVQDYRAAGRLDELIQLYESHVANYPQDRNARTVLLRLLAAGGNPETWRAAQAAVEQFPDDAYLRYVMYEVQQRRRGPNAVLHLDKAIELQNDTARKVAWIEKLLEIAQVSGRNDLARKQLAVLAELTRTPEARLDVARKMNRYGFHQECLKLLAERDEVVAPETMVDLELEAASAEVGLEDATAARGRLAALLEKLTGDYWRREEILHRLLALVEAREEREQMIAAARAKVDEHPRDEAAVLDLAQILAGFEFRRESLAVLLAAEDRLPHSEAIERRTLALFDRLRDDKGRAEYLSRRLQQQPQRQDLAFENIKSLYLSGQRDKAQAAWDDLASGLDRVARSKEALQLARFLRRVSLARESIPLFEEVLRRDPTRLDVRRELAEVYFTLGNRRQMRQLLVEGVGDDAKDENFRDLVAYMMRQKLYLPAREAIARRLEKDDENLELRMAVLEIDKHLGRALSGEELIESSRALCDTPARYRLWLEAAVSFHDEFDTTEAFLAAEQTRVESEPGPWSDEQIERRLAFVEVAAESKLRESIVVMLEDDLMGELPRAHRVRLRRALVGILEKKLGPGMQDAGALEAHLTSLGQEDPAAADEAHARLALGYARSQRFDLAQQQLENVDVERIRDPGTVSGLIGLYPQIRSEAYRQITLQLMRRLSEINPSDRANWKRWMMALAASRDEQRLRGELRRLLVGIKELPLASESRDELAAQLVDSYWRSIARKLASSKKATLADSLPLIADLERIARDDKEALWVAWLRAYVLNRLDRERGRDEAIAELARLTERLAGHEKDPAAESSQELRAETTFLAFPDGLKMSLAKAQELLTAPLRERPDRRTASAAGPAPPFALRWTYETGRASIVKIRAASPERLLVGDSTGWLHCVAARSGKLLWKHKIELPSARLAAAQPQPYVASYGYGGAAMPGYYVQTPYGQQYVQYRPATTVSAAASAHTFGGLIVDGERIYLPDVASVSCRDLRDGSLRWRARVGVPGGEPRFAAPVSLAMHRDTLVTFEPESGTITRIDPSSGKVTWELRLTAEKPLQVTAQNSGSSLDGDRLLVYGARTALVDLVRGEVVWSLEPWELRALPVDLHADDKKRKRPASAAGQAAASSYGLAQYQRQLLLPAYGHRYMAAGSGYNPWAYPAAVIPQQPPTIASYHNVSYENLHPDGRLVLTGPAVIWASSVNAGSPRQAVLKQQSLLLSDATGLQVISTDLPLTGHRLPVKGDLIGVSGRVACLQQATNLHLVDLVDPQRTHAIEIPGSDPKRRVTIDGSQIYIVQGDGIRIYSALSGELLHHASWPAELVPVAVADEKPPAAPPTAGYPPTMPTYPAQPVPIAVTGRAHADTSQVHDGVLYTTFDANQLVAIAGSNRDD